jgi:hypothetical protein
MNTGRCIKQAPYTVLMIQVRVNPFDQVIDFKEGHDLVTYNSNGWSIWTLGLPVVMHSLILIC